MSAQIIPLRPPAPLSLGAAVANFVRALRVVNRVVEEVDAALERMKDRTPDRPCDTETDGVA